MDLKALLLATLAGMTVGALVAAAVLVLRPSHAGSGVDDPSPVAAPASPEPGEHGRTRRGRDERRNRSGRQERGARAEPSESLTKRFSSDDPDVRHAAALELLRGGDDALAQARALQPSHPEGRALIGRVAAALQVLRAIRRGNDYEDLPEYERLAVFVKYAARAVPEELLRAERLRAWEGKAESSRNRLEHGMCHDGEVAYAELELLRVRWELGEVSDAAYAEGSEQLGARVAGWLAEMRLDKRVAPARVRTLEERVAELRK